MHRVWELSTYIVFCAQAQQEMAQQLHLRMRLGMRLQMALPYMTCVIHDIYATLYVLHQSYQIRLSKYLTWRLILSTL